MADVILDAGQVQLTDESAEAVSYFTYDGVTERIKSSRPIQTTLNSLYLGDHHKISSGGENIFFTNLSSDIDWYPMWGGIKDQSVPANQDITGVIRPSARVYSDDMTNTQTVGAVAAGGSRPYQVSFTPPVNESLYGVTVQLAMAVAVGDYIEFHIHEGGDDTGSLIYEQHFRITQAQAAGSDLSLYGAHPNETRSGSQRFAALSIRVGGRDNDLEDLLVRPSAANANLPWTIIHFRTFRDVNLDLRNVLHSDGSAAITLVEPTKFLVDSSVAATNISLDSTDSSDAFSIRDISENMAENPTIIHFRNATDTADLFTVTLNKSGSSYMFFKAGNQWYYTEEGLSRSLTISENRIAFVDFPITVVPTIGAVEYDNSATVTSDAQNALPIFISNVDTTGNSVPGNNSWFVPAGASGIVALDMGQLRNITKLHIWNFHDGGANQTDGVATYRIWGFLDDAVEATGPPMVSGVDHSADAEYTLIADGTLTAINAQLDHQQVNSQDDVAEFRWLVVDCLTTLGGANGIGLRRVQLFSLSQANFGFALQTEVLTKTNAISYTPTQNFHPATKKFAEDVGRVVFHSTDGVIPILDNMHGQELHIEEALNIPTLDGSVLEEGFRFRIVNTSGAEGQVNTTNVQAYERNGGDGLLLPANILIAADTIMDFTITDNGGKWMNIDMSSAAAGFPTEGWISDVTAQAGGTVAPGLDPSAMLSDHVTTLVTDTTGVVVTVMWQRDSQHSIPTVGGVNVTGITRAGETLTGTANLTLVDGVDIVLMIGGVPVQTLSFTLGTRPALSNLLISNAYPGAQTAYNAADNIQVTVDSDVDVDIMRIVTSGTSMAAVADIDVSGLVRVGNTYTFNIPAGPYFRAAATLTLIGVATGGAMSDPENSTGGTVVVDNRLPTISAPTAVAYQQGAGGAGIRAVRGPSGTNQQRYLEMAFDFGRTSSWEVEIATEANVVDGVALNFEALNTQHAIADAAATNDVLFIGGGVAVNNTTTDNMTLRLRRAANGSTVLVTIQVPILDAASNVTMTINGGTDLRSNIGAGAVYAVTIASPDLLANVAINGAATTAGVLVRTGGLAAANAWTITIADTVARGAFNITNFDINGASGIPGNLVGGASEVRGFIVRNANVAAFGNTFSAAVQGVSEVNIRVRWRGDVMTRNAADATLFEGFFISSMANPISIKLLDDAATGSSSVGTIATIEEIL